MFPVFDLRPSIATPRDRCGELLQAGVPYFEGYHVKSAQRRHTASHLPPPKPLYLGSAHRLC